MLNLELEIDLRLNSVAFLTTIFPVDEVFLIDFFDSLSRQTVKSFDLIVINDGYLNFEKIKDVYGELNIIEIKFSNTPSKNRQYGINYCIDNRYDVLIFGDSDDYFAPNRVEMSLQLLEESDIVVNDVSLFNDGGVYEHNYISNRVKNNSKVEYDFIIKKNIFGLSNTALNIRILDLVNFDKDLVAVDWYLYRSLLKNKNTAIFTNETITYYRQHEDNIVGLRVVNGDHLLWWEKKDGEFCEVN
jgi:hypothetical protein